MNKPTAREIRETTALLGKFAAVLEVKGLGGTSEHVALVQSSKFLRSLARDSEPPCVDEDSDGCATHNTARFPLMIVCPECGNKRCPKATHCANECTRSNEPGQRVSRYE